MALLAEELVEEWLNRQGYFTIRGIRLGVHEIDILAVKPNPENGVECRHMEVQASMRPVSFITPVPRALRKKGRAAMSVKRTTAELEQGVKEWAEKKFHRRQKLELMAQLWDGKWSSELVLNNVRSQEEVELIRGLGITILWLRDILASLGDGSFVVKSASGADFVDLIQMGAVMSGPAGGGPEGGTQ